MGYFTNTKIDFSSNIVQSKQRLISKLIDKSLFFQLFCS